MDRTFEFGKQNDIGQAGERLVVNNYSDIGYYDEDHSTDLLHKDGRKIELKTDTYSMKRTPNFFMERYSNDTAYAPGGPWQALEKGSDIFIYMFVNNKKLFVFEDITALIRELEELIKTYNMQLVPIKNKGYNTLGYKIPRETLSHLFKEVTLGDGLFL